MKTQVPKDSQCLDVLHHMLDLAVQTADAASTDKNHKLVLQAVREVTRLVSLINKISSAPAQKPEIGRSQTASPTPDPVMDFWQQWKKNGETPGKEESLEEFFKKNKPGDDYVGNVFVDALLAGVESVDEALTAGICCQDNPAALAAAEAEAA